MNASLPTLPVPSAGVDTAALPQGEGVLNQYLASKGGQFGPLLQQAVGALGETPGTAAEGLDAISLSEQVLPPEGKLLPLLQQVLDAAGAEGLDPDAVLEGIREKLEAVSVDTDLDPDQAVAIAIHQFIEENPQLAASIDTGLLRSLPGYNARAAQEHPGLPVKNPMSAMLSGSTSNQAAMDGESPETAAHRGPAGQARHGGEFMSLSMTRQEGNSQHEAATLFSRLAAEVRSASGMTEALPRNDSLLGALGSLTPTPPTAPAVQQPAALQTVALNAPFNQAGWDKALGERLQWMVGQGVQRASIKLNPAHLGPMEVRIQVTNEQANVHFTSAHTVVREALEASLPRLRDMFDNAGVELAEVDVSGHSFSGHQAAADGRQDEARQGRNAVFGAEGEAEISRETPLYLLPASGRLDLFA
ncbi:flagellar hook-length control protein FliK [Thiogranum longum]|uniref:Flagellar hook-length control protein FliK n=1 Tax=Thiogranum longum TaxID=1537524 RepID=A0A4R1HDP8_9GAMM|nr:flagellar hook-length control protein FliK [Thiogranum longum]TCK18841.1 flagellar hook-length control protein FliK [Thiogranum longum]